MNLSFPGARPKISFLRPVSRENFANALGQTCIHDLRLRHILEESGDGGEGEDLQNLEERLFNAQVVEKRCIGRKKRVAFVGEGVLMRKSKRTKTVPRRLLD